jgi:hypothetical protein
MLTEAASLESMLAISAPVAVVGASLIVPSVVVIAIDVEDLVTLHTQNTRKWTIREE